MSADTVKVKGSRDTEVYVSDHGYACIKQFQPCEMTDVIVALRPEQIPPVLAALQALYEDRASWQDDPDPDASSDA